MKQAVEKPIEFVGSSRDDLREFPASALRRSGYQLGKVQRGDDPDDWKPMPDVGQSVKEIRVACKDGAFRVFYVVDRPEAIYVLHAFRKTSQRTEKRDLDLAKSRFRSLG
ncbi:type II toxin-antitoxin system RelE/ParE family toxin [Pseudomonas syringae]|uniref:Phage-related protein n=2 Tax=Pseudomonas syringae TaxID=317 RepID=A0A656JMQ9_PSESF|nr:type II toxin-antitoxin system RelE/ParE family toxin [Pseudomonas syringae]EPN38611.1 hypothetical protein A245_38219 [Pseudomonas syringae pv. actinidiae ICMP 19096]EPM51155.1 hypothetical protein A246_03580 [Pseudomonas syringae pv. actinidiae ICMP 19098]EPN17034.1 hypothetical protein A249_05717 [Pseudomonas syringae pv. actinidiae ICMP 18804]EPN21193.1 hypothetical protein A248_03938 [Pseudomonas syringae pv. actinidiae ICMP 19100]EPN28723.1 hypothetical protein A247_03782 [Pseudomonas